MADSRAKMLEKGFDISSMSDNCVQGILDDATNKAHLDWNNLMTHVESQTQIQLDLNPPPAPAGGTASPKSTPGGASSPQSTPVRAAAKANKGPADVQAGDVSACCVVS